MKLKETKIAVLYGGPSSEREISLLSGQGVYEALTSAGYDARLIDVKDESVAPRLRREGFGFAFIALHGKFGEDGTLQERLDREGIPYSGSGPEACRRAMDKEESRRLFAAAGLKVPAGCVIRKPDDPGIRGLKYPLFTKPVSSGSSIGVSLVKSPADLAPALAAAFAEDAKVVVDEKIEGRELTVGILGKLALPVIEIIPAREFFDFAAKYRDTGTQYVEPRDLGPELYREIQETSLRAHAALGCSGFSRADLILGADGVYVLEINAVPGMTKKSLLPKMASKIGVSFPDLCVKIMEESGGGHYAEGKVRKVQLP